MWVDCKDCIYREEGDCNECDGKDGCFFGESKYMIETHIKLSPSKLESILGIQDIGVIDCSHMSDEEFNRIIDALNQIPN